MLRTRKKVDVDAGMAAAIIPALAVALLILRDLRLQAIITAGTKVVVIRTIRRHPPRRQQLLHRSRLRRPQVRLHRVRLRNHSATIFSAAGTKGRCRAVFLEQGVNDLSLMVFGSAPRLSIGIDSMSCVQ